MCVQTAIGVFFKLYFMRLVRNKIVATTLEERITIKSWGNYWGLFGQKKGKIKILIGIHKGERKYCDEAPIGLTNDYYGIIKLPDETVVMLFIMNVTREEILKQEMFKILNDNIQLTINEMQKIKVNLQFVNYNL